MSPTWGRVGLRNRFVQSSQKTRVTLAALIGGLRAAFLFHKHRPRLQGKPDSEKQKAEITDPKADCRKMLGS